MRNNTIINNCESSLTLYNGSSSISCVHGDFGKIADNDLSWLYQSSNRSGDYKLCLKTHFDALPAHHPDNWIESLNQLTSQILSIDFQGVSYPVDYYCYDESIVTPVRFSLDSLFTTYSNRYVAVAESQIPQTSTNYTSFCTMLSSKYGTLGFIGKNSADSTQVSLNIGVADSDLNISWEKVYTLNLQWQDGKIIVSGDSFPPEFRFDYVTQLADGSWLVTVMPNIAISEVGCEEINYAGTLTYAGEMTQPSQRYEQGDISNCSDWLWKSIKTNRTKQVYPMVLYSSFWYESDKLYSFSNYYVSRNTEDLPDIPLLFDKATMPCGRRFVNDLSTKDIWLKVNTTLPEHSAIIITDKEMIIAPGGRSDFFASKKTTGFIGCQGDGYNPTFILRYGSLDANGVFIEAGLGTIQFTELEGNVTVSSENLPTSWSFTPAILQIDGSWLITLSSI